MTATWRKTNGMLAVFRICFCASGSMVSQGRNTTAVWLTCCMVMERIFALVDRKRLSSVVNCEQGTLMATGARRPRILLVDDYSEVREMFSEYLQVHGFDVVEATNGIE